MLDIMYKLNDVIINRVCDFLKACTTEFKLTLVSLGGVMSPVVHHRLYEHFTIRKLWYKDTLVVAECHGTKVSCYQPQGSVIGLKQFRFCKCVRGPIQQCSRTFGCPG